MEFDPTNGIVGNHDLIRVAIARDPAQAVPLWGSWTGFPSDRLSMDVTVEVTAAERAAEPLEAGALAAQPAGSGGSVATPSRTSGAA
jgi:hypothetical protein